MSAERDEQRADDDCTICAIAMAVCLPYEAVMAQAKASSGGYRYGDALLMAAALELRDALRCAIGNLEHMAAWISAQNAGYSFECLGEDMPGMKAALAKAAGDRS